MKVDVWLLALKARARCCGEWWGEEKEEQEEEWASSIVEEAYFPNLNRQPLREMEIRLLQVEGRESSGVTYILEKKKVLG